LTPSALPEVYTRLPAGPILETPFAPQWERSRAYYSYQRLHRHPVAVVTLHGYPHRRPLRFRNALPASPDAILASRARSLIVHLAPAAEERHHVTPAHPTAVYPLRLRRQHARDALALTTELTALWGPPHHGIGNTVAWELDRVRARR
jgi:hypothetical protein